MFRKFFNKILGNTNDRALKEIQKLVLIINRFEPHMEILTDQQLSNKTIEFKNRISDGCSLDVLLPEAFATVREVSKRLFNMRHFDVQLMGGIVLNRCCIAEMSTGEGKTITSVLPAYLNALLGHGVHIVTVNDYLAKRDASNNQPLFEFLGLTVGVNLSGLTISEKRHAYLSDITYGTNNEYGFDYLRDNMIFDINEKVQRKLYFALIDEVDSILIDESRTPLIISGPTNNSSEIYLKINQLIPNLIKQDQEDSDTFQGQGHFSIDEKSRQVNLTERGLILIEKLLIKHKLINKEDSLYSSSNITLMHHVLSALRAHTLFFKNVDYIIKNNTVIIVDEHTGRTMPGRRWSDGLHQAIEAKENVPVHNENQTLASITFQNYFRLYEKLSGMTGTAYTEAEEFKAIYKLDTIVIPTNRPIIRQDLSDLVYMTEKEKLSAIVKNIQDCYLKKIPVLVGTISIEKSEKISKILRSIGIKHKVLNAKFHELEAEIISQAGYPQAITIATNMAGRGTDIILGGNWKSELIKYKKNLNRTKVKEIKEAWKVRNQTVIKLGGLHIIGTERHESRRIDNQLRGRSGRQGDPGSSRFYVSMEDNLMRIFSSNRIIQTMQKLGMRSGEAIEHKWITKAISNAQSKVENRNFDMRKQLLDYDDVANEQRKAIYHQRNEILYSENVQEIIHNIRKDVLKYFFKQYTTQESHVSLKIKDLQKKIKENFDVYLSIEVLQNNIHVIYQRTLEEMLKNYQKKEQKIGYKTLRNFEKNIMLKTLDTLWREHLASIDYLRQGIHLRGYAQKDPKQEYKRESFTMFENMLYTLKHEVIKTLSTIKINSFQFKISKCK
ncbi:preprotein translocase subunit, ATPase [Wigglesworthia glossinidia endosymbiont of Glossina morsitans morsitans (Yale colony)]|uniref:Protein translocase subunit SecA n=1 Tax=Wigglesworthia glossinidia endosymbiont of Glossina morsitans morsitans (Yale colony) TaxID=1142511 RepID=H6Q5B4_WIGGL|nr:preprotein translocase subunit SecA [Wigglesworthia glossinidia]AFA41399.1 preprotein translocase subunit, ATPase [Wigglesworthia glossinidia endosymbiont of Glossina morsitans morsitans (Yale colony)]